MKGVIYARYSSDNQREESIEGQIRECMEFAERNGITVLTNYIDRAFSAKTDNRPEFQRMLKDSAKHLFDVVIVWKLDRFARNRYDSAHNKALLRKNDVKVISAKEAIAEDSTGILLESLLEGYAEFYSVELAEKVTRGMKENALKCKYNGGGVPLGYIINDEKLFEIDPLTAPIVQKAFTMYSKGSTAKEVIAMLNECGASKKWKENVSINNITALLKNRRFIGEYRFRDVVIPNGIPAIISEELFNQVQERMAKNKRSPARTKAKEEMYLLTTKLFCGKCGAMLVGESGTSRNGNTHRYYKCATAKKKHACKKKAVKKDWIENLVIQEIQLLLHNEEELSIIADGIVEMQKKENITLPLLKKQVTETDRAINNMLNAIQDGIYTQSTKQRLDELEQRKKDLDAKLALEELQHPYLSKNKILFFFEQFKNLDMSVPEQRQRLVDAFINALFMDDEKIVFTFNYKKGSKTIRFSDINGSDIKLDGQPGIYALNKTVVFGRLFCFILKDVRC